MNIFQNILLFGLYAILFGTPMVNSVNQQQNITPVATTKSEIVFTIPPDLVEKGWSSSEPVKDYFKNETGVFFDEGKELESLFFDGTWACPAKYDYCDDEEKDGIGFIPDKEHSDAIARYTLKNDVYYVAQQESDNTLNEYKPVELQKNGKTLFTACLSQGSNDLPLLHVTKTLGQFSFDYFEHPCDLTKLPDKYKEIVTPEYADSIYMGPSTQNIYFGGETINQKYKVEGSAHLFTYKDKLGFIETSKGQKYIFFNGKRITGPYQYIRHNFNSDYAFPLMEVYDNGALIFIELKDENYFFHQVDLNQFL